MDGGMKRGSSFIDLVASGSRILRCGDGGERVARGTEMFPHPLPFTPLPPSFFC
jgi:hypothetical protein